MSDHHLPDSAGTVVLMTEREPAELLMLSSVVRHCRDCDGEQTFVVVEPEAAFEFACTECGAAVMIDPALHSAEPRRHVA